MKLTFPVGIEVETGLADHNPAIPATWEAGTDVSSGLEFRSTKIVDDEVLFYDTAAVCTELKAARCRIHNRCGLHVHIGFKQIEDLSAKYRLFRFVSVYEDLIFRLMPPWADRATYCKKLTAEMWASFQRGEGFTYWKSGSENRYWWFNGAAMLKHGTIEFRNMNGTIDSNEILGWVSVLQCLFQAAVIDEVKLNWCDKERASVSNLVQDLHCSTNSTFGRIAAHFINSKNN